MLKSISRIKGDLRYAGDWDASTNTPTLTSSVGREGDVYLVTVAGSTNLNGITNWGVGDWAVFMGGEWRRIEGGADGNFVNLTVTGVAEFADGLESAPSITNIGDTDTGAYFPTTNTVALTGGAKEGIRVSDSAVVVNENSYDLDFRVEGDSDANLLFVDASTDRIGVGTATPSVKFDVSGDSSLNGAVVINENGADKDTRIEGDSDANLLFADASTDRIGVGTSTPASKLDVNGDVTITDKIIHSGDTNTAIRFPTNDTVTIETSGNEQFRVSSTGNVGVGTNNPGSKLDVAGDLRLRGSSSGYVGFQAPASSGTVTYTLPANDGVAGYVLATNGSGVLSWADSDLNGVDGPASSTDNALVRWDGITGKLIQDSNAILTDAGVLTLQNGAVINEAGADSDTRIEGDTDVNLIFADASADFVGIGTNAPGSKLDVAGALRLRGSSSGYVGLQGAAAAGSTTYTLPAADGSSGQVLTTNGGGALSWQTNAGGDVFGPGSATDEALARFDGITGKLIQNSNATLTDAGVLTLTQGAVVNESGADSDFRVEGDTDQYLIFADASTDQVAIGASSVPTGYKLGLTGDAFVLGRVVFREGAGTNIGYVGSAATYTFVRATGSANGLLIGTDDAADVIISTNSVYPAAPNNRIFVAGSTGYVGINRNAPGSELDVKGTLRLSGSTSGYVGLAPQAAAGSTTYILPAADGAAGQVLATDGTGNLGWVGTGTSAVFGPGFSTVNALTRWGDIAGTSLKNSTSTLTDAGFLTIENGAVINEAGADSDFRVEGDTDANLIFADASTDRVGVGTNAPLAKVQANAQINTTYSSSNTLAGGVIAYVKNTSTTSSTDATIRLEPTTAGSIPACSISAVHTGSDGASALTFGTRASGSSDVTEKARIDPSGNLGLGVTPSAWDSNRRVFQVGGSGAAWASSSGAGTLFLSNNAYFDGSNFKYLNTSGASYLAQQTDGSFTFNQAASGTAGNNITFTQAMTLDASGNLGVGTTSPGARISAQSAAGGTAATFSDGTNYTLAVARSGASGQVGMLYGTSGSALALGSDNAERARITSGGDLLVGKTSSDAATNGCELRATGSGIFTADGINPLLVNRNTSDGTLVLFRQDNIDEGSISVSGNTVSYNAFAGSHWSQLQDGSKPDILRGTVMESINELCEWPGEQNERLPKAKISDTANSKKVYGVFMAWDNDWSETNDMYVTAVGAFICRVNADVTVQEGDLLESNGDGTARVQADDIIRSSTIGKVTSTVKTHEYDDGSYCVPTVLYCG